MIQPKAVSLILASPLTGLLSRILATCLFWSEFLNHMYDLTGLHAYVVGLGMRPVWLIMGLSLFVQAVGSALVIADFMTWLGAGMLGAFTLLTVPIAHHFWDMTGPMAMIERLFSEEHLSVIGGLMAVCIASHARRNAAARPEAGRNSKPRRHGGHGELGGQGPSEASGSGEVESPAFGRH